MCYWVLKIVKYQKLLNWRRRLRCNNGIHSAVLNPKSSDVYYNLNLYHMIQTSSHIWDALRFHIFGTWPKAAFQCLVRFVNLFWSYDKDSDYNSVFIQIKFLLWLYVFRRRLTFENTDFFFFNIRVPINLFLCTSWLFSSSKINAMQSAVNHMNGVGILSRHEVKLQTLNKQKV